MWQTASVAGYRRGAVVALGVIGLAMAAFAQLQPAAHASVRPDWRRLGNSAIELFLASPATGPVARVWYSEQGDRLFLLTRSGLVYESVDFEGWKANPSASVPLRAPSVIDDAGLLPEPQAYVSRAPTFASRLYAIGRDVYRSDDSGLHWINLTRFRGESILGEGLHDLAVSPTDPDEIVVANDFGVWRSLDGGLCWSGLNESLPNLPVQRILFTPAGARGIRILLGGLGPSEWLPGERQAWRPVSEPAWQAEQAALRSARAQLGETVTAVALGDLYSYAGSRDGRLWVSTDQGASWRESLSPARGAIHALRVYAQDSRLALAAASSGADESGAFRVLRTLNGGAFWDDLTADLPAGKVSAVAIADSATAVYVATDKGVFLAVSNFITPTPSIEWVPINGNLPTATATDVVLDQDGNQVYVALDGYGVFVAVAPHRFWRPKVVNAADLRDRAAAPGSLVSVLGARLLKARAGVLELPVLHASEWESQVQVPFEVTGSVARLSLEASNGKMGVDLPLEEASPAIFVDRDGTPLLLDADTGVVLDAMHPARSSARIQILATGLGKVKPSWPTGMAAPMTSPPQVVAPVHVYLDGLPLDVIHATLAPGYVGFYLVEVQLPAIVNGGFSVIYLEFGGAESNRVGIHLEP